MFFLIKNRTQVPRKRNHLRNRFPEDRCPVKRINYVKERNYCISLLRKTKNEYYANLNKKDVLHNKKFKSVKSLLSDKLKSQKITCISGK